MNTERRHTIAYRKEYPDGKSNVENYSLVSKPRYHSITEESVINSNGSLYEIKCTFDIDPTGYSKIDISIVKDNVETYQWSLDRKELELYTESSDSIILVDGPNPMFSLFNAQYFIDTNKHAEVKANVLALDWRGKGIHTECHTYRRDGSVVEIIRGDNDSIITYEGDEIGLFPKVIHEGSIVYHRVHG